MINAAWIVCKNYIFIIRGHHDCSRDMEDELPNIAYERYFSAYCFRGTKQLKYELPSAFPKVHKISLLSTHVNIFTCTEEIASVDCFQPDWCLYARFANHMLPLLYFWQKKTELQLQYWKTSVFHSHLTAFADRQLFFQGSNGEIQVGLSDDWIF